MLKRGLSALVGIGIFLALCFGGLLPFAIGATVIAALATYEWVTAYQRADKMEAKAGDRPRMPLWLNIVNLSVACAGVAFPLYIYTGFVNSHIRFVLASTWVASYEVNYHVHTSPVAALLMLTPVLIFVLLMLRAIQTGQALGIMRRIYGLVAFMYIGVLMSSMVLLRTLTGPLWMIHSTTEFPVPHSVGQFEWNFWVNRYIWGAWLMLLVAVCVWMTDTGAYLVGRKWGRHKLAPALSPNKTVEGSLGGLTLAVLTGVSFGAWIHLPWQHGLAVGLIAGVMGQMGDLFESALKREIGIKDFGGIMPGHGGALDRFDSLLFVTPLAFCYLHFVAKL